MPKFQDIPQYTHWGHYSCSVSWQYLFSTLDDYNEFGLDMNPDFQRGHVWTRKQSIAYVEFGLKGGRGGRDILFNCPGWHLGKRKGEFVLVDGKQRLNAVIMFLKDELPAFGCLRKEYTDKMNSLEQRFLFHINDMETRREMLQWYLDLNTGGVVHTSEEIEKVKFLLEKER